MWLPQDRDTRARPADPAASARPARGACSHHQPTGALEAGVPVHFSLSVPSRPGMAKTAGGSVRVISLKAPPLDHFERRPARWRLRAPTAIKRHRHEAHEELGELAGLKCEGLCNVRKAHPV